MSDAETASHTDGSLRTLVAEVVAAYFTNAHVNASDIPSVIGLIAESLGAVGVQKSGSAEGEQLVSTQKATRAQIRKSISPDALISFEDRKPYKTLRRHLSTYGLTPDQYREKWGLPSDYPMVSPNYSAARSQLAKSLGLGQRGQTARRAGSGRGEKQGRRKAAASAPSEG